MLGIATTSSNYSDDGGGGDKDVGEAWDSNNRLIRVMAMVARMLGIAWCNNNVK